MTTMILSNEEMDDIVKILKSLEDFGLLIKGVSETTENDAKKQKRQINWSAVSYNRC